MLFLADESCDFAVVRALRDAGYDVLAVAEAARGATDPEVIRLATHEQRILLTEDKDFGWLVYAAGAGSLGVVLIRFPSLVRRTVGGAVLNAVRQLADRLRGSFVVVEPGRLRVSATPLSEPPPAPEETEG
jgi:predicted nuclease of predicted toxin-antitoxin system